MIRAKQIVWRLFLFLFVLSLALLELLPINTPRAYADTATFTTSGSWQAPKGVNSVQVECWGGGGAGGGQNTTTDGGGGGGGGAYSIETSYSVTPLSSYSYTVGSGGTGVVSSKGNNGGDTYWVSTGTVLAKGGIGGSPSTGTPPVGGAGGASGSGVGDTKYSGGQGEKGRNATAGRGGYGGSSAGTAAVGWSGPQTWSTVTYPTGSTPTGGGHGGDGGLEGVNGSAPVSGYGGGGGGSGDGTARTGGAGYGGKITITYTVIISVTVSDASIAYGFMDTSTSKDTTSDDLNDTQAATNNGVSAETFNIAGQNSANWTLSASAGSEQYVHAYCTSGSGSPDPCDSGPSWTALTTGYQTLATNVAISSNQRFDLKLSMPTGTANYSAQTVSVTVQAILY